MLLYTVLGVVARNVAPIAFPDTVVISKFLMLAIVFSTIAKVQMEGGHIRAEIAASVLPVKAVRVLDVIALLIAFGLWAVMTWALAANALTSIQIWEYEQGFIKYPVFVARIMATIGAFLLSLEFALGVGRQLQQDRSKRR